MLGATSQDWFGTDLETIAFILASTAGIYVAVIVLARLRGLRSFSKMSAFDVAMSVAMGTILASTATSSSVSLPEGIIAAAAFFGLHAILSVMRRRVGGAGIVDNRPKLLVRDGKLIEGRLDEVGMTEADLAAKLRAAGIARLEDASAVVMETTGDVSVLSRDRGEPSPEIFAGVDLG